jgi:hypothetical protein
VSLADVVQAAREAAKKHQAHIRAGELVGLAPEAALDGFPSDFQLKGFDERAHVLEKRLTSTR